eukprot:6163969-Prymnesium_polylepis.1
MCTTRRARQGPHACRVPGGGRVPYQVMRRAPSLVYRAARGGLVAVGACHQCARRAQPIG